MKVVCVIGTRPEAIKMAPVILHLKQHPDSFDVIVVSTGQHRELLDQILLPFEIKPDINLDIMEPNQSLAMLTCRALEKLSEYLAENTPDLVLAQGDTTTVMVSSLACFYQQIKFGHVEAGLRTGNMQEPYPEEFNRCLTGLVTTYHFAPTATAEKNLQQSGVAANSILVTGNTIIDALFHTLENTQPPELPVPGTDPFILMTCHRREIFGEKMEEIFETIREYASTHKDLNFWYPVHPNPQVKIPAEKILGGALQRIPDRTP